LRDACIDVRLGFKPKTPKKEPCGKVIARIKGRLVEGQIGSMGHDLRRMIDKAQKITEDKMSESRATKNERVHAKISMRASKYVRNK
jgi:hypothetical protein